MRQNNAGGIVARVKTDFPGSLKFLVKEVLHPVPVLEEFLRVCRICDVNVIDKAKSAYAAGGDTKASVHPLRTGEGEFPLVQQMFQRMDVQILVTLVADEIMPVPFMIAHEEILAMGCLDVLPVCKAIINSEDWRMIVDFIVYSVVIQPGERSLYFF